VSQESRAPRVLLVEDDPAVRRSLARLLASRFEVTMASDALEAVELLSGPEFAVVVSDYQMPGEDGIWLLSQVQSRCPSARRVLISGVGSKEFQRHVDSGLVHSFLQKPLGPEHFVDALEAVLRLPLGH